MAKTVEKLMPKEKAKTQSSVSTPPEGENIDKIRDILFGTQARQFETKLSSLEARFEKDMEALRNETRSALDSLEHFIKREAASLSDQLRLEKDERLEADDALAEKLDSTRKTLDKKRSQLNDKMVKDARTTQEQILHQSKTIMDELHESSETLQERLDQSVKELRHEKTDRLALANLMMEIAIRLKDDFQVPDTD